MFRASGSKSRLFLATIVTVDPARELQRIYDGEINVRINGLWDCGIEVRLGDEVNGFLAEETFALVDGILPWLQQAIAHFYPASTYAQELDPEVSAAAAKRVFVPPSIGRRVNCPHCGAPNAAPRPMEEFAFICSHCGESVSVGAKQIQ